MKRDGWILVALALAALTPFAAAGDLSAQPSGPSAAPQAVPAGQVASQEELAAAQRDWPTSGHADTYDTGQGANTTCARCKSPRNWDPAAEAAEAAHDCSSCKRVPGAPRPDLEGGITVSRSEWRGITCDICHQPAGDSYSKSIAFWNQALGRYEPVRSSTELCAKCHEGQHGFEVVEEQSASPAHQGWDCTRCHGPHGKSVKCSNCHDPSGGRGAEEHARHPGVGCSACHDAGGLDIWRDQDEGSRHQGQYMTVRFAHALTSWPSHNLKAEVDCTRCHHPQESGRPILAESVSCSNQACHPEGAMWKWCPAFERDPAPAGAPRR